jgi:hypothetical protein
MRRRPAWFAQGRIMSDLTHTDRTDLGAVATMARKVGSPGSSRTPQRQFQ